MNDTRSLCARLMLLYTGSGFIIAATLGVAIVVSVFAYVTRPLARDIAQAVQSVETGLGAGETIDALEERIAARRDHHNVVVIAIPPAALQQQHLHLPSGEISIAGVFGLGPTFLNVRDSALVVVPKASKVDGIFRSLYLAVALTLGLALWIAWFIACIATRVTLQPLLTVTTELERFGRGDFTPRTQQIDEQAEFGALAAAYNAAAQTVTDAFLERRRAEDQIRQFVAEAGHELRTPLTVVAGYIDVLRRGGVDDLDIRRASFASLTIEVKRMRTLVERLMTLARLDRILEAEPEVVDVGAIVRQAVDAFAVITQIPIALSVADDLLVLGEPVDLYEAVANLLENALKYGENTPVSVTVAVGTGWITVRVRDCGPGIPESHRARIFERFYRGTDRGEIAGSGLGLAIAVKAAERLGGRLDLEDARAGSTTFALVIPALDGIGPLKRRASNSA